MAHATDPAPQRGSIARFLRLTPARRDNSRSSAFRVTSASARALMAKKP